VPHTLRESRCMPLRASQTPGAERSQEDQGEALKASSPSSPGSRPRLWIKVGLLALPCLGLVVLFLAPWLFPGAPVGNYVVTPPHPVEVGQRLVGPVVYTLDARASDQWTYFDFSRGSVVEVPHQFSVDWDLAFQRHKILANGGATNPKGKGAMLNLGEVPFEEVTTAPTQGYVDDTIASITPDSLTTENLAVKAWYRYNMFTHILRPKPNVYVIRTADGKYAKMHLLSYYCAGGEASGCFTFEYVYQGDGSRSFLP
jgi:heme-binding HmuY-like protein